MRKNLLFTLFTIVLLSMATTMRASNDGDDDEKRPFISIGYTELTETNNDVFGNGTVGYNAETRTLTLKNFLYLGYDIKAENLNGTLNIEVFDDNYVGSLSVKNTDVHIFGHGSLTIDGQSESGILLASSDLKVDDCTLELRGAVGIDGNGSAVSLNNVDLKYYQDQCFKGIDELWFDGCYIDMPFKGYIDDDTGDLMCYGGMSSKGMKVHIARGNANYNPWIKFGDKVITETTDDIFGDGYARYDSSTNTLSLFGLYETEEDLIVNCQDRPFHLKLFGYNYIHTLTANGSKIIVEGGGTLCTMTKYYEECINLNNSNMEVNLSSLEFSGGKAIAGNDASLTLNYSDFYYNCGDNGCVDLKNVILDGCHVEYPQDVHFDPERRDFVDDDGNTISDHISIVREEIKPTIKVGEKQIEETSDDVFGDGTVSYDADSQTLTLNNFNDAEAWIDVEYPTAMEYKGDHPFNIELKGDNTVHFFYVKNTSMHIYGDGSVKTTISGGREGFSVNNSRLLIEDCTMELTGIVAFDGEWGEISDITMRNVDFTFECSGMGCFCDITDLQLERCYLEQPEGCYFDKNNGYLVDRNGEYLANGTVHIARLSGPEILIGEKQIVATNNDVFGDGTVSYDADTRTLTFNNFNASDNDIWVRHGSERDYENDNPFNLELKGENTVWFLSIPNANVHVYGEGSLRTTIPAQREGFSIDNSDVLVENCTLYLTGASTFYGDNSSVTMRNVDFTGNPSGASNCFNISKLILQGCYIEKPEGYYFDYEQRTVVGDDGESCSGVPVHIARIVGPDIRIGNKQLVATNNDVFGDGTVSYDADTHTLTLNNFKGSDNDIWVSYLSEPEDENDNPFSIKLVGDNTVLFFSVENTNMHIYGDGSVKTSVGTMRQAFSLENSRLLIEDCTMDFSGIIAFTGRYVSDITMRNVDFTFECHGMGCFYDITDLKLEGCYVEKPVGYFFDKETADFIDADGHNCNGMVVHITRGTNGIINVCNDSSKKIPAYNINGQRVSAGYKGIVIENGKKKLSK